jgi:site-specific DNA-cytosine methylase
LLRGRLERYHAAPERPPLDPGTGWIAQHPEALGCEVFFFGDVRALNGQQILGGPPCQGFSKAGK